MVEGEYSLKMSAPQLLQFGVDSFLKILNERITEWMNYKWMTKVFIEQPRLRRVCLPEYISMQS